MPALKHKEGTGLLTVLLTDVLVFPVHCDVGPSHVRAHQDSWQRWRGRDIEVWPAEEPSLLSGWTCGTRRIWRVHREYVLQIVGALQYPVYVCEHQIQMNRLTERRDEDMD